MDQDQVSPVEQVQPRRRFFPESPAWQRLAYDDERVPPDAIVRVRGYDPRLYFRFNRIFQRWELWHWKSPSLPQEVNRFTPEEIVTRSYFVFSCVRDNQPFTPDGTIVPVIRACDWWTRYGGSVKAALQDLEAADQRRDDVEADKIRETFLDIALDNKQIIRRFFGFSTPFYFTR